VPGIPSPAPPNALAFQSRVQKGPISSANEPYIFCKRTLHLLQKRPISSIKKPDQHAIACSIVAIYLLVCMLVCSAVADDVCVRARARARVCVCAFVCACVYACVHACVCVCV